MNEKSKLSRIEAIISEPEEPVASSFEAAKRLLGDLIEIKPEPAESESLRKVLVQLAEAVRDASDHWVSDIRWVRFLTELLNPLPAGDCKAYYAVKAALDRVSRIYAEHVYRGTLV